MTTKMQLHQTNSALKKELASAYAKLNERTCQNCKYWLKEYGFSNGDGTYSNGCGSGEVHANLSECAEFWPPADFGCNRWGPKT